MRAEIRGDQTSISDVPAPGPGEPADRQLRALSTCSRLLISATDEPSLLRNICRVICGEAGYRLAWVGYLVNDPDQSVAPMAWAGVNSGYIEKANISWSARTERGRGPTGTAARTGETYFVRDFSTDERIAPWRAAALRRGYRSSIAVPLKDRAGAVFGVLTIYSSRKDGMTAGERWLPEQLSADLAFGITVLRDRVERRRAEEAVRQLNRELEQRVADRTSELEAANRELEAFSYSVSHDLRGPLRALDGFSELLLEQCQNRLDEEGRDYLDRIRRNADRMDTLIDDILTFSRTGRQDLVPVAVDMAALSREVFDELRASAGERDTGRDIEFDLGALPAARGDRSLIRQVLINLLRPAPGGSQIASDGAGQVGLVAVGDRQ